MRQPKKVEVFSISTDDTYIETIDPGMAIVAYEYLKEKLGKDFDAVIKRIKTENKKK